LFLLGLVFIGTWSSASDADELRRDPEFALTLKDATVALRTPKEQRLVYKGLANFDEAAAGSAMLYQVPNAAGLVAAILTHGAIISSARESQKTKLQEEADKVLGPYLEVLNGYTARALMERAARKMTFGGKTRVLEDNDAAGTDWVVRTDPVFFMTQDQTAIALHNTISIHQGDSAAVYQNIIRVNSAPENAADISGFWKDKDGEALKDASSSMFAQSLDIAIADATRGTKPAVAQRTFRYLEGNVQRVERAELVSELCDRVVLRTLRGWLMSVPVQQRAAEPTSSAKCK
jgi:hypothetical protein